VASLGVPARPGAETENPETDRARASPSALREHSFVADGQRGALIDPTGNIAWLCFPTFSSPAFFASLLGSGGTYRVSASGLFSEEYDVCQHQLRGNLPQAFVHALLIEAAAAHGALLDLEPASSPKG